MTRDEILNMAREAGLHPRLNDPGEWWGYTDNITRFSALVEARALAAPQAEPVVDEPCRCQRLGDYDGKHHPLCDSAVPQADPLFLLHTGQIDSDGEQDEWEAEADSQVRVDAFCRQHPGQTIGLHPAPAADVVRDAAMLNWLIENCLSANTIAADRIPMSRAAIDAAMKGADHE